MLDSDFDTLKAEEEEKHQQLAEEKWASVQKSDRKCDLRHISEVVFFFVCVFVRLKNFCAFKLDHCLYSRIFSFSLGSKLIFFFFIYMTGV